MTVPVLLECTVKDNGDENGDCSGLLHRRLTPAPRCGQAPDLCVTAGLSDLDELQKCANFLPCGRVMVRPSTRMTRHSTRILLVAVVTLVAYIYWTAPPPVASVSDDDINIAALEEELEVGKAVKVVVYKSPLDPDLYVTKQDAAKRNYNAQYSAEEYDAADPSTARTLRYNRVWRWADRAVSRTELFPESPDINKVFDALATARIVNVDILSIGDYESGTSEKWVATLEGGQKAMMKLLWANKGKMKKGGLCNYGFEIPTAEIAAFHFHRIMGFRNTPYVTGRRVHLRQEVLPVASPNVAQQIELRRGNETCVKARCYFCKTTTTLCLPDGVIEVSLAYWIPRKLKLHTYPPEYMPYSTPSMSEWSQYGLNNRTYCNKVRRMELYDVDKYFYDLLDSAILDAIMYHFDTKHYTLDDGSEADGLTVRLDHGRAFCAYDKDDLHIFLAPIEQCCTLRKSTWESLNSLRDGALRRRLREAMQTDPIAPILDDIWYPVLERRLASVLGLLQRCADANGGWGGVLVEDTDG